MDKLPEIIQQFQIQGDFIGAQSYETGHINETFASSFSTSNGISRYIHQRINQNVFLEPWKVMANIERTLEHARRVLVENGEDTERGCLSLVPTLEETSHYQTANGDFWRTYIFIEGARTYDFPANLSQVHEAACAFGKFQRILADLPGDLLYETIPNFHNTPLRFQAFLTALGKDIVNRAAIVKNEVRFIQEREALTSYIYDQLTQGIIPTRITHNDAKLNNVLIDDQTGTGLCVIDLDTVMPGSALYDFGDLVRSCASISAEDEPDIRKVGFSLENFKQIASGYLQSTRSFLAANELDHLWIAGIIITLEQAIRFLTDYLQGDPYYKIKYPEHNLVRCHTQLRLIAEMERQQDSIHSIIDKLRST